MKQGKINLVGMLGLPVQELRLVKNMLKLTANRPQGGYELNAGADQGSSDVIIVNADDADAMASWRTMAGRDGPPVPVLVSKSAPVSATGNYHLLRPLSPIKLLALLDRLVVEMQIQNPEQQIFSGKNKSEPDRVAPGSTVSAMGRPNLRRALVVDDSPTVLKQLELELKASNIYVDTAETGEAGLELLEKNSYDIIFLDVVLPGTDGYQVCKNIKKNPAAKQIPVVMLTSKSSPFDRVRGSLAGCNSYLTKPVDYEKFMQVLEEYKV